MENLSSITSNKDIPTKEYVDTADAGKVPTSRTVQGQALSANVTLFSQFTVTLTVAGWSGGTQTITNSNFIVSGYTYFVTPAPASFNAYSAAGVYASDVTTASKMTFNCSETPTEALTVVVTRMVL